jgi:hypothetical protein
MLPKAAASRAAWSLVGPAAWGVTSGVQWGVLQGPAAGEAGTRPAVSHTSRSQSAAANPVQGVRA